MDWIDLFLSRDQRQDRRIDELTKPSAPAAGALRRILALWISGAAEGQGPSSPKV